MRVVDHRQFKLTNKKRAMPRWIRFVLLGFGAFALVFVIANLVMGLVYRNKVLPNYSVAAVPIGGVAFSQLDEKVSVEQLLPKEMTFKKDDKTKGVAPKDLGVSVDWDATRQNIKESRSWLPLMSFVVKRSVPAELKLDNATFAAAAKDLETTFTKTALPERIAFQNDNFAIVAPEAGYQLDVVALRQQLVGLLEQGKANLAVPTTVTTSDLPTGKLQPELSRLQKELETSITLVKGTNKQKLDRANLARLYEPFGQSLQLSDKLIASVVAQVGATFGASPVVNQSEAVRAVHYAFQKKQPVSFVLADQGARVYNYCVAAKGVNVSYLADYKLKLAAVYGEPRGWNNGGEVALVYAESGCDFTAWLSAPSAMTSFGSICDNYYSCRVGSNVVVNYDRWMGATDPWNAAGGTLEDYRVMVINHETGHWFGFGHRSCPAAGQPAPVMQQQSISLAGCTFNPWPTAAELAAL